VVLRGDGDAAGGASADVAEGGGAGEMALWGVRDWLWVVVEATVAGGGGGERCEAFSGEGAGEEAGAGAGESDSFFFFFPFCVAMAAERLAVAATSSLDSFSTTILL
jgi:hypothetical protein